MTAHLNPLDILLESQNPDRPPPDFRWGNVVGIAPDLRVSLDRDPTTVIGSCCSLTWPLEPGDRVMVMIYDGRAVVFGRGSGDRGDVSDLARPLWGTYYPELHATSTDPSGSGVSSTGKFAVDGSTCHFSLQFNLAAGWNRGSGNYQMSLPVPPAAGYSLSHRLLITGEVAYGGNGYPTVSPIETTDGLLNRLRYIPNGPEFDTYSSSSSVEMQRISLSGTYEVTPPPARALYVSPHQDDEMLTMGAAIREEVANGTQVTVLLCSRGENSAARTSPALTGPLGYTPTPEEFSAQRDKEFKESVRRMGARAIVPPWSERFADSGGTSAKVQTLIQAYGDTDMALRGTSPSDYHVDHQAVGQAIVALDGAGYGDGNPRLMLSDTRHETNAPAGKIMFASGGRDAITSWHAWPYTYQNIVEGWWGIGYISVGASFDHLLDVCATTAWHLP